MNQGLPRLLARGRVLLVRGAKPRVLRESGLSSETNVQARGRRLMARDDPGFVTKPLPNDMLAIC